jgi:transcriptional regulator with XRE-family HTH domain
MMILTSAQCRSARAWLNISQEELSIMSKVAKRTIALFEIDARLPRDRTLEDIRRVLEGLGMGFTFDGLRASGITASETARPVQKMRRKAAQTIEEID